MHRLNHSYHKKHKIKHKVFNDHNSSMIVMIGMMNNL